MARQSKSRLHKAPAWKPVLHAFALQSYDPAIDNVRLEKLAGRFAQSTQAALKLSSRTQRYQGPFASHRASLDTFFGVTGHDHHCFHTAPITWLDLTEPQTTKALASMLNASPPAVTLALLHALDPLGGWPAALTESRAEAEVISETGRIDLLITAQSNANREWRVAIEAKFGHHLKNNDLAGYRKKVETGNGRKKSTAQCRYYVLGLKPSAMHSLEENEGNVWKFVHWQGLMRRFERALQSHPGTNLHNGFPLMRRMIWEKL